MTKRVITLFMWGYQEHFNYSLSHRAEQVFSALGVDLPVQSMLVGVRVPDSTAGHPVCVEPEDGPGDVGLFAKCHGRASEINDHHPDQLIFYGDEPSMRDKPEKIWRKSVRDAVKEVLEDYDRDNATRSFCGLPTRVNDYFVVPVLQVTSAAFEAIPALSAPFHFDLWTSVTGMGESVMSQLLREATEALNLKDAGRSLDEFPSDPSALLREAGRSLCDAIPCFVQDFMLKGIFDYLNDVAATRLEGADSRGEVAFVPPGTAAPGDEVVFKRSVHLSQTRLVRKVVEMSSAALPCRCSSYDGISGLGVTLRGADDGVFRAVFTGHFKWELRFGELLLMRCAYGVPELPRPGLTEAAFRSNAERVLPGMTPEQSSTLWEAVSSAMEQSHGTMFVVSDEAEAEANRLSSQALPIEPMLLARDHVRSLSSIDGAILVDRDSNCRAVGVILDGLATAEGDSSRGARYNSAIRYVATQEAATLCIVVSEDGYVDMLPTLRPQIPRDEVAKQIDRLTRSNAENYYSPRNWLHDHRFYLSEEQCRAVNAELDRLDAEVLSVGGIRLLIPQFTPNPDMNDSYFSDITG